MIDAADRAATNEARVMELFEQQHQDRYHAPADAWKRGQATHCLDCGVLIPAARLQAVPQTYRCIKCAEKMERR